jgi:hypothetical protein
MNESEQLKVILSWREFWEREDCKAYALSGGISVEITGDSPKWGWKVKWPSSAEKMSDRPFPSLQDAKLALREFLTQRLTDVVEAALPPARSDIY